MEISQELIIQSLTIPWNHYFWKPYHTQHLRYYLVNIYICWSIGTVIINDMGFPLFPTHWYCITYRQGKQLIEKHENNINNTTWHKTITYDANTSFELECSTYLAIIINSVHIIILIIKYSHENILARYPYIIVFFSTFI